MASLPPQPMSNRNYPDNRCAR